MAKYDVNLKIEDLFFIPKSPENVFILAFKHLNNLSDSFIAKENYNDHC